MKSLPILSNEHTGCCAPCWEHRATLEAAGRKQVQVSISGVSKGGRAEGVGGLGRGALEHGQGSLL